MWINFIYWLQFQVPLVISLVGNQPITAENPSIKVRVSHILVLVHQTVVMASVNQWYEIFGSLMY